MTSLLKLNLKLDYFVCRLFWITFWKNKSPKSASTKRTKPGTASSVKTDPDKTGLKPVSIPDRVSSTTTTWLENFPPQNPVRGLPDQLQSRKLLRIWIPVDRISIPDFSIFLKLVLRQQGNGSCRRPPAQSHHKIRFFIKLFKPKFIFRIIYLHPNFLLVVNQHNLNKSTLNSKLCCS